MVVRTDPSVTEVWYHIDDADTSNDDTNTRTQGGNGTGFEPFTDTNCNGTRDAGEPFEDLNGNGVWDSNLATTWVKATESTATPSIVSSYPREWRFNYNNIPSGSTAAQIKVRLRELSSAEFKDFSLSDAAGHYTTLVRNVTANGPVQKMFVAFPPNDGTVVDDTYVMKVWFSKSLADGTTTEELINRFLIKIASSESGSNTNGVAQSRAGYSINYNVTSDYHELAYTAAESLQRPAGFPAHDRRDLHAAARRDAARSLPSRQSETGRRHQGHHRDSAGSGFRRTALCHQPARRRQSHVRAARGPDPGRDRHRGDQCRASHLSAAPARRH